MKSMDMESYQKFVAGCKGFIELKHNIDFLAEYQKKLGSRILKVAGDMTTEELDIIVDMENGIHPDSLSVVQLEHLAAKDDISWKRAQDRLKNSKTKYQRNMKRPMAEIGGYLSEDMDGYDGRSRVRLPILGEVIIPTGDYDTMEHGGKFDRATRQMRWTGKKVRMPNHHTTGYAKPNDAEKQFPEKIYESSRPAPSRYVRPIPAQRTDLVNKSGNGNHTPIRADGPRNPVKPVYNAIIGYAGCR